MLGITWKFTCLKRLMMATMDGNITLECFFNIQVGMGSSEQDFLNWASIELGCLGSMVHHRDCRIGRDEGCQVHCVETEFLTFKNFKNVKSTCILEIRNATQQVEIYHWIRNHSADFFIIFCFLKNKKVKQSMTQGQSVQADTVKN